MSTTTVDVDEAVTEVNRIREELGDRADFRRQDFLDRLADRLEQSSALSGRPMVQAFIEDIRGYHADPRLSRTKALTNANGENTIFGLFDASYFPSLSLDFLSYRTLPTDEHLAKRYASPTMPVVIERMSKGFQARTVVALFPENYLDGEQHAEDPIFYFIDKFVERHVRVTRLLIQHVMAPSEFPLLRDADEAMLETASTWWVRLHEYHHRQGDMPIPAYLFAKKTKAHAGLEELRTDVSSMLVCLNDKALPAGMATFAYQFILAERLLRYSVEGARRPNYDAVASQVLFNYLTKAGGIVIEDGRIHLRPELPQTLAAFLDEVGDIERRIHAEPVEAVKVRLLDFSNGYADYDAAAGDYRHIPFFAEAKTRLRL